MAWIKQKTKKFHTYRLKDPDYEPELMHFIRTGFNEGHLAWLVVYEDAYELDLGDCQLMSTQAILDKFGIDLNEA